MAKSRKSRWVQVSPPKGRGAFCLYGSELLSDLSGLLSHSHTRYRSSCKVLQLLCDCLRFITKAILSVTFPALLNFSLLRFKWNLHFLPGIHPPPVVSALVHRSSKSVIVVPFLETLIVWRTDMTYFWPKIPWGLRETPRKGFFFTLRKETHGKRWHLSHFCYMSCYMSFLNETPDTRTMTLKQWRRSIGRQMTNKDGKAGRGEERASGSLQYWEEEWITP